MPISAHASCRGRNSSLSPSENIVPVYGKFFHKPNSAQVFEGRPDGEDHIEISFAIASFHLYANNVLAKFAQPFRMSPITRCALAFRPHEQGTPEWSILWQRAERAHSPKKRPIA